MTVGASDWWIWLVVGLGALLVVVVIIIVVVCCVQRRNKDNSYYSALPASGAYTPVAAAPVIPQSPAGTAIAYRITQDVVDVGEGILPGKRGQICFVEPVDAAQNSDWCWATVRKNKKVLALFFFF